MKLEEAASILGVHPDTPIETLKQTYRRLALAWHPDKVKDSWNGIANVHKCYYHITILSKLYFRSNSVCKSKCEREIPTDFNSVYEVDISTVNWRKATRG